MNVGWIGLGKLGLPCALALTQHHKVTGYDLSPKAWSILSGETPPMQEEGIMELLTGERNDLVNGGTVAGVVAESDIVFVAVQTPHEKKYGGEQPMPDERADFDYTWLTQACQQVASAAACLQKEVTLVVISTVLPGTTNRLIRPLLNRWVKLVYSPQFIAMGTTIWDFTHPEFVICGTEHEEAEEQLREVFTPLHGDDRLFPCDITTAESIKVLYNTWISQKIVWANHVMELCDKTGADCDAVVDALSLADERVISAKYMRGGMGDGGACHPRDLIALSWLEQRLGMSIPLFEFLARSREEQTKWLADLVAKWHVMSGYNVVIMGRAYKPGSDLTDGSPAILLQHYLAQKGLHPWVYDPHTGNHPSALSSGGKTPLVYVIATRHPEFRLFKYRPGSIVIDPFGYVPEAPDPDSMYIRIRPGRHYG